ncbi:MAG: tRNA (N6-isopentenyl adenosine(37)-C2)-methylthiotransferase MiaB [Oscillospiraceae bacterium]|nr:tRNA (N6-isopentenyl adenosine(37)-C2)-methylthiotransferase MiaB [Oscillospiraceae bacterium]
MKNFFPDKVLSLHCDSLTKPTAFVRTYGCQQNFADSEQLSGLLQAMGYGFVTSPDTADLIIFNTCAVRENAEERVFGNVGALKKLKERNPNLTIVLCGCMFQQEATAFNFKKRFPFVDIIFGTANTGRFAEFLFRHLFNGEKICEPRGEFDTEFDEDKPVKREDKLSVSIPIMSGCNNFCSYCIVPYVRGRERSRSADAVVSEAAAAIAEGAKQIMLLGQNVNSYGNGFTRLLSQIDSLEGEFFLDYMTSHPKDCTKDLIDLTAQSEKITRRLHLPVQSGSDRVLSLMNRGYNRTRYLELVRYAKEKIPDLSLTTDIIVGFPGETEADFADTLSLIEEARFDSAYTFLYSKRSGTAAAELIDDTTADEKAARFKRLLEKVSEVGLERYQSYVGQTLRVLFNKPQSGKSRQGITVEAATNRDLTGTFADVTITEAKKVSLIGALTN